MTETIVRMDAFAPLARWMDVAGRWLGRAGFGVFAVAAIMIAVVATTFVGALLAAAIFFLQASRAFNRRSTRARADTSDLLEARPTADGWVIEGRGGFR